MPIYTYILCHVLLDYSIQVLHKRVTVKFCRRTSSPISSLRCLPYKLLYSRVHRNMATWSLSLGGCGFRFNIIWQWRNEQSLSTGIHINRTEVPLSALGCALLPDLRMEPEGTCTLCEEAELPAGDGQRCYVRFATLGCTEILTCWSIPRLWILVHRMFTFSVLS